MQGGDAVDKIKAGANLVQLYSGFIYRGPRLIKDCRRAILEACATHERVPSILRPAPKAWKVYSRKN